MADPDLRAIIFDIGRVLVRVDVARAMSGLASGLALSPAELWSTIEKDPLWAAWQEGRVTPRDWYLHLTKRTGATLSFEQFTEIWNRALDQKPIQNDGLLEKLSKRYRLAVLSNTDPIHLAHLESTFDFLRFFSVRIYSCTVGARKPNPIIYKETLRACKVRAEQALYIDDVAAYVEAARRLGLTAIQFQSSVQLVTDLQAMGVRLS